MTDSQYAGYKSYSYLTADKDYEVFELDDELGRVPPYDLGLSAAEAQRVQRLLDDNVVISLHDHPQVLPRDIAQAPAYSRGGRWHMGYEGLSRSGLTAVFDNMMNGMSCITSKWGWKWDDIIYDLGMRRCDLAHQDFARVAERVTDIEEAKATGRLAVVLALEAATPIENEVDRLDILYGFGVRQCGIAYAESNALGTGHNEVTDGGLTQFGRRAIERMNDLGIAIDVSHSSDRTCLDTFEVSSHPVFITHAGARGVWDTPRMKPDEVLVACAEGGGVIGLEAAPHTTLSKSHPLHSLESVMDHFTYCVDLVGVDHVAFGPDTVYGDHVGLHSAFAVFSSGTANWGKQFERVPYVAGLENPTENFFNIVGWLVKNGYCDEDIKATTGGNVLRVLESIW
jgi:membrane dipeptidase